MWTSKYKKNEIIKRKKPYMHDFIIKKVLNIFSMYMKKRLPVKTYYSANKAESFIVWAYVASVTQL